MGGSGGCLCGGRYEVDASALAMTPARLLTERPADESRKGSMPGERRSLEMLNLIQPLELRFRRSREVDGRAGWARGAAAKSAGAGVEKGWSEPARQRANCWVNNGKAMLIWAERMKYGQSNAQEETG